MRQIIELLKLEHETTRAQIGIVSSTGEIVLVNSAWRDFWNSQGWDSPCGEGEDIFQLLQTRIAGEKTGIAPSVVREIEAGLHEILGGQQFRCCLDYQFQTPSETLLFKLHIRPVDLPDFKGAQLRIESRPRFRVEDFCC